GPTRTRSDRPRRRPGDGFAYHLLGPPGGAGTDPARPPGDQRALRLGLARGGRDRRRAPRHHRQPGLRSAHLLRRLPHRAPRPALHARLSRHGLLCRRFDGPGRRPRRAVRRRRRRHDGGWRAHRPGRRWLPRCVRPGTDRQARRCLPRPADAREAQRRPSARHRGAPGRGESPWHRSPHRPRLL
ncbi:MAG: NADH dehydrogenase (ubiquinone), 24 kDa subunit, partial [uncultured Thermomicrobiales bacterium]